MTSGGVGGRPCGFWKNNIYVNQTSSYGNPAIINLRHSSGYIRLLKIINKQIFPEKLYKNVYGKKSQLRRKSITLMGPEHITRDIFAINNYHRNVRRWNILTIHSTCKYEKTISNDVRQNVIELCVLFFVTYCQKKCVWFFYNYYNKQFSIQYTNKELIKNVHHKASKMFSNI